MQLGRFDAAPLRPAFKTVARPFNLHKQGTTIGTHLRQRRTTVDTVFPVGQGLIVAREALFGLCRWLHYETTTYRYLIIQTSWT